MGYIVHFDISAICVMAVVILSYCMGKRLHDVQNRVLLVMLISNMVSAVMDVVFVTLTGREFLGVQQLLYVTDYLYYVAHILTAFSFFIYCTCLAGRYRQTAQWKRILLLCPMAGMTVAMVWQLFMPIIFSIDERGVYQRENGIYLMYVCSVFYVACGIGYLIRYRRKTTSELKMACPVFGVIGLLAVGGQYLFPELMIETFGISICILLLFLAMDKPDELIDPDLDVMNQRAMLKVASGKFQTGERFSCIMLKIHNVKVLRQTIGADAVLNLLKEIVRYLETNFEDAVVFHFSQSTFVLLLDKRVSAADADEMVTKIRRRFEHSWDDGIMDTRFHIHLAYMQCPHDAHDMDTFMNYLQYMRSNVGDNQSEYLVPADMDIEKRTREMIIRKMIADALENGGFEVFYQPIYSVADGRIVSAEALVRLKDQTLGYISPEEFIPIAEQSGTILKIGEYVFETVCCLLQQENLKEHGIKYIEINLSIVQCIQDNLVERLISIMDTYQIRPEQINLEITETAAIHSSEVLENNICRLHEYGIAFSLDDYGSGYSNTDYLFRFPFQIVKIDKLILWEACKNEKAMIALKNTIQMIKELGLEVVVEGVETIENVEYLKEQNCDYLQGYYFSKPVPKQRFMELVKKL